MTLDQLQAYALGLPGTTYNEPFGPGVLAFRVMEKIFALVPADSLPLQVNLKCDPERAVELRDRYEAVTPGYHMNKKHWNTVVLDSSVPPREVEEMILHSYNLIVGGLSRKLRSELESITESIHPSGQKR
jgi:predicted DNA-binding protein (MmcQ/YjbR family)